MNLHKYAKQKKLEFYTVERSLFEDMKDQSDFRTKTMCDAIRTICEAKLKDLTLTRDNNLKNPNMDTRFNSQLYDLAYNPDSDPGILKHHEDTYFSMTIEKCSKLGDRVKKLLKANRSKVVLPIPHDTQQAELIEINQLNHCANPMRIEDYLDESQHFCQWWTRAYSSEQKVTVSHLKTYHSQSIVGDISSVLFDRLVAVVRLTSINECYYTDGIVTDEDTLISGERFYIEKWCISPHHLHFLFFLYLNELKLNNENIQAHWLLNLTNVIFLLQKNLNEFRENKVDYDLYQTNTVANHITNYFPGFGSLLLIDLMLRAKKLCQFSWCMYFDMTKDQKYGFAFALDRIIPMMTSDVKKDMIRNIPIKIVLESSDFMLTLFPLFLSQPKKVEISKNKKKKMRKKQQMKEKALATNSKNNDKKEI